jgi:hypothetical protein
MPSHDSTPKTEKTTNETFTLYNNRHHAAGPTHDLYGLVSKALDLVIQGQHPVIIHARTGRPYLIRNALDAAKLVDSFKSTKTRPKALRLQLGDPAPGHEPPTTSRQPPAKPLT